MYRSFIIIFISGLSIENGFAKWPEFETTTDTDFIYNQKQVYYERKGRFIKFDTKENELEVELGISIPFMKIPLRTEVAKHSGHTVDSKISINAAGLLVAGVLMLTSFFVVPLLFTKTNFKSFGIGRSSIDDDNDIWRALQEVDHLLAKNNIDSMTCAQKTICWIAKVSKGGKDGSIGKKIDYLVSTWWANRLMNGTFVYDAVKRGQSNEKCSTHYPGCPLTQEHLKLAVGAFATGLKK